MERVERRPVLTVFVAAFVLRVLTATFISQLDAVDTFAPDAANYFELAADKAAGTTAHWDQYQLAWYESFGTYLVPLTVVFKAFGAHVLLAQIVTALWGAMAAALVAAIGVRLMGRGWGMGAGLILVVFPSQVLWSSLILRDPASWAITSAAGLTCVWLARSRGIRIVIVVALIGVLVFLMGNLRMQTLVVMSWALALAGLFMVGRGQGWPLRVAGLTAVVVLVPWAMGAGPAGSSFVQERDLVTVRANLAEGADTAIVRSPVQGERGSSATQDLEDGASNLSYLPRGLSVMLLEPFPWTGFSGRSVRLAQAEHVLWYPALGLAIVGVVAAVRRRLTGLAFPTFFAAGILAMYALAEGNFGTAYRHRGEAIWAVVLLATLGAQEVWHWSHRRRVDVADGGSG